LIELRVGMRVKLCKKAIIHRYGCNTEIFVIERINENGMIFVLWDDVVGFYVTLDMIKEVIGAKEKVLFS